MATPVLTIVTREQGNNAAMTSGEIVPEGYSLAFQEVPVLVHAFRRMVRDLEFDVCEMALTTYLCAREHGVRFTALPVFLVRAFHHGAISHRLSSGLTDPRELEGKRVGINRGYTVTTGVWARAVLQDEYGVDLSKITWVLSGDEHVETYRAPSNVVPLLPGTTIEEQLISGELAAAIGLQTQHPDVGPLIPNADEAGLSAFKSRGHYPINHLIVVADHVLERYPDAAVAVYNAFKDSKDNYIHKLKDDKIDKIDKIDNADRLHKKILDLGADPLPYGLAPNNLVLNELIAHARTQNILSTTPELESLFAPVEAGY